MTEEKQESQSLIRVHMTQEEQEQLMLGPVEDYSTTMQTLDSQEVKFARRKMNAMKHGFTAAVPLTCIGERCPMSNWCPFVQIGKVETLVGKHCPIEVEMMLYKKSLYFEEYKLDQNDSTMVAMVNRLVELDVQDARASVALSMEGGQDLLYERVQIALENGTTYREKVIHPAFLAKEKIQRQKIDLLKEMVGTPREKYKRDAALKQRSGENLAKAAADLKNKAIEAEIVDESFISEKGVA